MEEKKETKVWGIFGKASLLVAFVWGLIQVYNYFFKSPEFSATIVGNHCVYETSPIHIDALQRKYEYEALIKTTNISQKDNIDSLLNRTRIGNAKSTFEYNLILVSGNHWDSEFNSLWTIKIKNSGNKPLEEVAIELPFEGIYKIILPNNVLKTDKFKNSIVLGDLRPSYEAIAYCWVKTYSGNYFEADEEKSRVTHKNGWFNISYPVEVTGIVAWNKKNYNTPVLIGLLLFFFIVMMSFALGEIKGIKKAQKKNEQIEEPEGKVNVQNEATKSIL